MESEPKITPRSNARFFTVVVILFFIIASFFAGFYFGIWQVVRQQFGLTAGEVIKAMPQTLFSSKVDTSLFSKVWQTINNTYVGRPVPESKLFYGALEGMVGSLNDPYSIFLDPDQTTSFNKELNGSLEGIGAELGIKNSQLTVITPLPDSPAAKAGLRSGDKILKVDNRDTAAMSLDEAIGYIRGAKGSTVVLNILSAGDQVARDVSVVRDVITVQSVTWSMKDNAVAYVQINQFNSDTYPSFQKIVNEILVKNPQGLILDLRNNPGGYLDSAVDVTGEFIDKKVIVIEDFGKSKKEYMSQGVAQLKDVKMVVLTNGGSASSAEIVSGALQDYGRATLVGEKTFGKGSVQDFEQFNDGSSLKLTVAKWLTPKGRSIDKEGIVPDVEVPLTDADYNNNRDPQLDKALELLKQ